MRNSFIILSVFISLSACTPKVQVEAPKEPIVINLNIEHRVKVEIDKDLDNLLDSDEGLF